MNIRRIFACLVLVLVVFSGTATAESISGGHLFAVFADGGTFTGDPTQLFTVAHLFDFGPSEFPDALEVIDFPAYLSPDAIPVAPGGEFFLLGAVYGTPDHLLISAASTSDDPVLSIDDDPLHAGLIAGVTALAADPTLGPIGSLTSEDFFDDYFPGIAPSEFFANPLADEGDDGPTGELGADGGFEGGEDIFGFTDAQDVGVLLGSPNLPSFENPDGDLFSPVVPEPASATLLGLGLAGTMFWIRRRRRAA